MSVLCSGSVAVDHIMVFQGRFKDVILPDRIHMLSVAFYVPELRRSFGGTAANIAFNLKLLGDEPIVLATVGASDFDAYAAWLERHGISQEHILRLEGQATAGAYITTDLDDNQITGFHPGAMDRAHEATLERIDGRLEAGIVAPNGKRAMQEHARGLKERGVPTVIDPGQQLPVFEKEELLELLDGADVYIVNDYEWELTLERTGLTANEIAERVGAVVVTLGDQGSRLRCGREEVAIPAVPAQAVVDPTGCGDAYRAGFLHGLCRRLPLETCARMGSLLGSLMVERQGTQSLTIGPDAFEERYRREFGAGIG